MKRVNTMVYMALLISMQIILTRFVAIETPIVRIGFGFIPIAMAGIIFGPILAGSAGVISDLLGMMIFPKGAYFPGFTVSAFLGGVIYGIFLYKRELSFKRVILAVTFITVFVDIIMNTYWLTILTGKAVNFLIIPRVIKSGCMFPVHVIIVYFIWKLICRGEFMPTLRKI